MNFSESAIQEHELKINYTEPIDLISEEDFDIMEAYRNAWVVNDHNFTDYANFCDTKTLLREWNFSKTLLMHLLGEQLIVEKSIEYNQSEDQIHREMDYYLYSDYSHNKFIRDFNTYISQTYSPWGAKERTPLADSEAYNNLHKLVYCDNMVKNYYQGETFKVPLGDGKFYTVRKGCKISRTLGKLAELFNLSHSSYEEFRIEHSQILNQKHISGKMCLSIHPLDFWTMSSSGNGWSSCMSWENRGCYRQGTVEMMNSPCVIEAYVTSEDIKLVNHYSWNKKKWRELFIVTPDIITEIKSYPYRNDNLSQIAVKWIKDLAEKNLGYHYKDNLYYSSKTSTDEVHYICDEDKESSYYFYFDTDMMYNDIDSNWSLIKYAYISEAPLDKEPKCINYSGKNQCMYCGEFYPDFFAEGELVCEECQQICYCSCCGEPISEDDIYYYEDECYCEDCYNDLFFTDELDEEDYPNEERMDIRIIDEDKNGVKYSFYHRLIRTNGYHTIAQLRDYLNIEDNFKFYKVQKKDITNKVYLGIKGKDLSNDYLSQYDPFSNDTLPLTSLNSERDYIFTEIDDDYSEFTHLFDLI